MARALLRERCDLVFAERHVMQLSIRTIRHRGPTRVGRREKVAHWGFGARVAAGVLALLSFALPLTILALGTWTDAPLGVQSFVAAAPYAYFVFHVLLVFLFASFVLQNPRIYGLRTLWLTGVVLLPPIAVPAYWWMHVWNAPFVDDVQEEDELVGSPKTLPTR